jgi:hypothetical protein
MNYTYEIFFNKYTKRTIVAEKFNGITLFYFKLEQIRNEKYISSFGVKETESFNRVLEWLKLNHPEFVL